LRNFAGCAAAIRLITQMGKDGLRQLADQAADGGII
jgi:hypothetical protein